MQIKLDPTRSALPNWIVASVQWNVFNMRYSSSNVNIFHPKKLKLQTTALNLMWSNTKNAMNKLLMFLPRCCHMLSMSFLSRGMQEAALYEEGHRKHSGSGGLPAWRHFYGGALWHCGHCVDTSMGHCWPIPTDFWPPSILSYHVKEDFCLRAMLCFFWRFLYR